jgi:non-specific serine/threonine protein kinase
MLETVREHAVELLGDDVASIEERHASFYLAYSETVAAALSSPDQPVWIRRLQTEDGNLKRALRTLVARGRNHEQLRMCAALWPYWRIRGQVSEGRGNLGAALAATASDRSDPIRAFALRGAAVLADMQGDYERSAEVAEDLRVSASAIGDVQSEASALNILGSAAIARGDAAEAADLARRSVFLLAGDDYTRDRAFALINLGNAELNRGDFHACSVASLESARLMESLGDRLQAATPLYNAGLSSLELGGVDEASRLLRESFQRICQLGHVEFIANGLDGLAAIGAAQGAHEPAALRRGAADALRRESDTRVESYETALRARTAAALDSALGVDRVVELSEIGASDPWAVVAETLATA